MDETRLSEIEARLDAAMKLAWWPWTLSNDEPCVLDSGKCVIADCNDHEMAALVLNLPPDLRDLLASHRTLSAALAQAEARIAELQECLDGQRALTEREASRAAQAEAEREALREALASVRGELTPARDAKRWGTRAQEVDRGA